MKATTDRIITATYCDDIRQEVGNKLSLMGIYQSELLVASAPTALPKLCVWVTALTPIARPFEDLTIRLILGDDLELARVEITADQFAKMQPGEDKSVTRSSISTAMAFSPFIIEKSTQLRVVADTVEGRIVGPRLLIKVMPDLEIDPKPRIAAAAKAAPKPRKK